ncbi:hypothetical protein B0A55_04969 [Friedmanniomyces simplex]|uniref:Uncharacterized protein n=1 Tax=Friedmanniomyces simplex TaxID=329884 RepID=A0A4U0XMC4_9PEZI|nr:hypothetical protein B0A55_04969 [Friedmanniomyces simplex]
MPWLTPLAFSPALPAHCEPTTDFLLRFSSAFHTCVPTPLAFTSSALGTLSIIAWLFAQLPQIYKNYSISSTSGLSIFFLVEWCLGDIGNLFGALLTHQASWQVAIGGYYVFVDLCLVAQWVWYERLRHGVVVRRAWTRPGYRRDEDARRGGMEEVVIEGMPNNAVPTQTSGGAGDRENGAGGQGQQPTRPKIIFRAPTFQGERRASEEKASSSLSGTPNGTTTIHRSGPSCPLPSPSPRTILLLACLLALAQASPLSRPLSPHPSSEISTTTSTPLETLGTALAWLSTTLYLLSRLPQLIKNHRRKSTAGLSPHLFLAAFSGNLCYSAALLTNPCAWADYPPFGSGGWVGGSGSRSREWGVAALPFFLGAAGVLGLDASVGWQFWAYGREEEGEGGEVEVVVVVVEEGWKGRHWRRVSGWMRGWVPGGNEGKEGSSSEREGLLGEGRGGGYGTGS